MLVSRNLCTEPRQKGNGKSKWEYIYIFPYMLNKVVTTQTSRQQNSTLENITACSLTDFFQNEKTAGPKEIFVTCEDQTDPWPVILTLLTRLWSGMVTRIQLPRWKQVLAHVLRSPSPISCAEYVSPLRVSVQLNTWGAFPKTQTTEI